jgi:hypothetical protein
MPRAPTFLHKSEFATPRQFRREDGDRVLPQAGADRRLRHSSSAESHQPGEARRHNRCCPLRKARRCLFQSGSHAISLVDNHLELDANPDRAYLSAIRIPPLRFSPLNRIAQRTLRSRSSAHAFRANRKNSRYLSKKDNGAKIWRLNFRPRLAFFALREGCNGRRFRPAIKAIMPPGAAESRPQSWLPRQGRVKANPPYAFSFTRNTVGQSTSSSASSHSSFRAAAYHSCHAGSAIMACM